MAKSLSYLQIKKSCRFLDHQQRTKHVNTFSKKKMAMIVYRVVTGSVRAAKDLSSAEVRLPGYVYPLNEVSAGARLWEES